MKLFIEDLEMSGKKVLMRVDFNVPLDGDRNIIDASRIEATLPSIHYVLNHGGALILMSHLGRPKAMVNPDFSLAPCAAFLEKVLNCPVALAPDCTSEKTAEMAKHLKPGQVLLLENLRFNRAEEHPEDDPSFAKRLASYGDLYVNDAFGCSHRKHSSIYTITQYFPGKAAAGFLLEKEIRMLSSMLQNPKRPLVSIIGGAKISSKIGVLNSLLDKVDTLIIGGGMAFTFLKAMGIEIGKSIVEETFLDQAKAILAKAKEKKIPLLLPLDNVIVKEINGKSPTQVVATDKGIPSDFQGVDIGPKTIELFTKTIRGAKTILWNGPLGVYEIDAFAKGTNAIAKCVAESGAITIVGGGDSVAAIQEVDLADKITHLSTGGGATLEYIEFGTLPGVEALSDKSPATR